MRPSSLRAPERAMPLDFGDPPRACDMPHRMSVGESNSGGRATSRSRAPRALLTQVLVQGSFLLLTYSVLVACTTRCYSHVLVNVLVNIHAYSVVLVSLNVLVRTTFPHLYYYPRINRLRPNFQTTVARAPCFSAARGAGSARWVTPQPRDCVSMCDVLHVSLHLRLSIPH